ncbi:MAG TPA: hypothetical protein VME69_08525 [Methylocella sp.]|nr:hypothetical protein [Methylocella sp.]
MSIELTGLWEALPAEFDAFRPTIGLTPFHHSVIKAIILRGGVP